MTLRRLTRNDLARWVSEGWLTAEQAARIEGALEAGQPDAAEGAKGLNLLTVAYYFGALLIIGALAWFLVDQWDVLGPRGILAASTAYAALFLFVSDRLRARQGYPVAAGVLATCAVWMVPLMTYSIERALGVWPLADPGKYHQYYVWINGSWIVMEAATVAVGLAILARLRFPFVTFPIAFALWFFSMDLAGILMQSAVLTQEVQAWCSVLVGAPMIALAFALDRRFREDLSFWIYLYGLLAFWGGLSSLPPHGETGRLVYFGINLVLGLLGLYLQRGVFLVFATFGVLGYLSHLAHEVFRDSVLFPFVVAFLGLGIILAAVALQRHRRRLDGVLDRFRPSRLRLAA